MSAPVVRMLWKDGYVVQVAKGARVVWQRRAGRNRQLLRRYLERAAAARRQMLASA